MTYILLGGFEVDPNLSSRHVCGEIKSQRGQIVYEIATMIPIHIPYFSTRVKTRQIVAASIFCAFFFSELSNLLPFRYR